MRASRLPVTSRESIIEIVTNYCGEDNRRSSLLNSREREIFDLSSQG